MARPQAPVSVLGDIVERFFAHLMCTRRVVRDFERRTTSAEAVVPWSMILVMTRRLARKRPQRA
ncbi:hypothetical protein ACGFY7_00060 [Streptomyces prunicolor]|uniref:hypothetical protein n=1 Tax=Streptomyces prunicolor TaxID=67348 RepID=UPI00370FB03B